MTAPTVTTVAEGARHERVDDPFGAPADLVAALVVALAVLVAVASLLGPLGLRPLAMGAPGIGSLLGFFGVTATTYAWLRRDRHGHARPRPAVLVTVLPALVLAAYVGGARALPLGHRTEWYLGGDHVRHLIMTAGAQATGWLSYATESYPRAWHTVLAATWSAFGLRPEDDLAEVVDLSAMLVWLLSALLALATASLAATWAYRTGLTPGWSAVAGFTAGVITLTAPFLGNFQGLGLEGSLVSACTLAAVLRSQLVAAADPRTLIVAAGGVVVIAHSWQLLLPVVGLAALRSAVLVARSHGRVGTYGALALAAGSLAASFPSLVAVVTDIGIDHATDAGVQVPVPWVVLGLGLPAAGWRAIRGSSWERWVLGLLAVPAVTGLALAAYVGITPETYYASKLLWHTATLMLAPLAVVAVTMGAGLAAARSRVASVSRVVAGGAAILGAAFASLQPAAAFLGMWSTAEGPAVVRLLTTPGAGHAQVVWSGGRRGTSTITRVLLDAVRSDPGPLRTPQRVLSVTEECDLLRASAVPTVLTDRREADVRTRYACVPGVRIVEAR